MHRRLVLPPSLAARPFTVAEGRAAGLSPDDLRSPVLRTPYRGARVPAALPDSVRVRCLAAALALPTSTAFDGVTALALHDLPVPRGADPTSPLVVRVATGVPEPRVRGVQVRVGPRGSSGPARLRTVRAPEAWAALATDRRVSLEEMVVVGDAIARQGGLGDLRATVESYRDRRAVRRMREALALVRERVDSPQETRTRLLVVRAGIPEPVVNRDVHADDGSGWLFRPDLRWLRQKVALEYDGLDHVGRERRRQDIARRETADQHGWRVVVATAPDLTAHRGRLVARVEDALHERGLTW